MPPIRNEDLADILERVADLLEAQHASVYRVEAYRKAGATARKWDEPLSGIYAREGRKGIVSLPGFGESLAGAVAEIVTTGRLGLLDRLEGEVSPEDLFTTVPGIGDGLAHRIHDQLGLETLEELELAAHDGRLEQVPGIGPRRARSVREILGNYLSRSSRRRSRLVGDRQGGAPTSPAPAPSVETLLAVDREYRQGASRGELRTIAPRRFNPEKKAWLPILHTERGPWSFTALYSNTARAHKLGRTRDWVVIYYDRDGHEEQVTVVTEYQGDLAGQRVVRGRESECREYYWEAEVAEPVAG